MSLGEEKQENLANFSGEFCGGFGRELRSEIKTIWSDFGWCQYRGVRPDLGDVSQ